MPYFIPVSPDSGELTEYNRRPPVPFVFLSNTLTWTWAFSYGDPPLGWYAINGVWPRIRMCDATGAPVTDWVSPDVNTASPRFNRYTFTASIQNGHHLACFECEGGWPAGTQPIEKGFVVNSSGMPLPIQNPWTTPIRFELSASSGGALTWSRAQVHVSAITPPKSWPLKDRDIQPYSTRLPLSRLWARRIHIHNDKGMIRRAVTVPTGDTIIEQDNKYFAYDAYQPVLSDQPRRLRHTLKDGPRNVSTLGFLYTLIPSPQSTGWYWSDVLGRVGFLSERTGQVTTIAGARTKAGALPARGLRDSTKQSDKDFYGDSFEVVGDFSLYVAHMFNEPWGLDSIEDPRMNGLHEFWLADTWQPGGKADPTDPNGAIAYINHFTAHEHAEAPLYAPQGYVAPEHATGQSQIVTWLSHEKLAAMGFSAAQRAELLNQPWGIKYRSQDNKIYWTNFGAGTIGRANVDGTSPEVILRTKVNPTNAQLGLPAARDLFPHGLPTAMVRSPYHRDDNIIRPLALDLDSQGNLIWIEAYTYAIKRGNPDTGVMQTVALLNVNSSQFGLFQGNIAVDRHGWIGPVDDIIGACWHNTDFRYDKNGIFVGRPFFSGSTIGATLTGPADRAIAANYGWGVGIGKGRMVFQGNAAGSQFQELTPRLSGDTSPDYAKYSRALTAYKSGTQPMALLHGSWGQGELGYPNWEEMGSWTDDEIKTYAVGHGLALFQDDFLHLIRHEAKNYDYSQSQPTPVNCEWAQWSEWVPLTNWSMPVAGMQSREERRTRDIATPAQNGGLPCEGPSEETRTVTRTLTLEDRLTMLEARVLELE